eukprot:scaffold1065_cov406-Prasinococcus_capsulatus_cf.AAC.3
MCERSQYVTGPGPLAKCGVGVDCGAILGPDGEAMTSELVYVSDSLPAECEGVDIPTEPLPDEWGSSGQDESTVTHGPSSSRAVEDYPSMSHRCCPR